MFALVLALSFIALLILLPLTTSARLLRVSRELEELRDRFAALEAKVNALARLARSETGIPDVSAPASARPDSQASFGPPSLAEVPGASFGEASVAGPPSLVQPSEASSAVASLPSPARASDASVGEAGAESDLDLEGRIGGRWLLYTGVLVLLLGVSFFLKYAFDNEWIDEFGRVFLGAVAGIGLIAAGWQLSRREFRTFGQALIGTGIAVLYLSIYAALSFYGLIDRTAAFALMVAVTIAAAVLADRQRSQSLALIAVGGGFVTPFLVGGREDAQLTLFSYDALLVAGTLILAQRHQWFALNAMSYMLTCVTILGWADRHYTEAKWLRTFLFLTLFCVMFVQILRATRRAGTPAASFVAALLTSAPVFYHIVAVVLTAAHPPAIHIYMIAFTAVGLWLTAEPHRPRMRLVVLAGSYLPLFGALTLPAGLSWLVANVVTIVAIAALHLLAVLDRVFRQEQELEKSELVAMHVSVLGLFGLLYQTLRPAYPDFRGALAAVLAIGAIALWQLLESRDYRAALNACALAFTLTAVGVAVQFDGPAVVIGWAAEGAAAAWIGLRVPSLAFQIGGLLLWGIGVARLLDGYFATPAGFKAIFNERALTSAFVIALAYVLAWLFKKYRGTVMEAGRTRAVLHVVASLLTMLWITAEVRSYWAIRYEIPQAYLYQQLVLSLTWAIYGAVLIVAGMWRGYAPDRYIGITVLAMTILKVFFVDLWQLGGIYRVIAFIGFGVLLMAVSYLYQKRRGAAAPPLPPPITPHVSVPVPPGSGDNATN